MQDLIKALKAVDAKEVQYPTWITEAWRHLQWAEPTAKLLWEMLSLFRPKQQQQGGGENATTTTSRMAWGTSSSSSSGGGGEGGGVGSSSGRSSNLLGWKVQLADLVLFLWLHLPDSLSKVSTHPATYNIVWPPTAEMAASNNATTPGSPIHGQPTSSSSFPGPSSPSSPMAINGGSSLGGHHHHGNNNIGGIAIPGGGGGGAAGGGHAAQLSSSPISPRSSPRSYFQMQVGL